MGAFNFIESFFLLSLGITFVLIVLLVYHFKQRLSSMEQKCDTMFDIVQNLVKELKAVKSACQPQPQMCGLDPMMCMMAASPMMFTQQYDADEGDEDEDDDEDEDGAEDEDDEDENSVKIIHMEVGNKIEIIDTDSESNSEDAAIELDVEEPVPIVHKIELPPVEYKKMTVAELKQIVSSKGLSTNVHKLTKTELLKLLNE